MRGWDDEAVFVIRNRHDLVHFLDLRAGQMRAFERGFIHRFFDRFRTHVAAHRNHGFQGFQHRRFIACGE